MHDRLLHHLIERLRQTGGLTESGQLDDRKLLGRFVRSRDEAAFAVLAWRYCSSVFASAHRLLGNDVDTDDLLLIRSCRTQGQAENYGFGWFLGFSATNGGSGQGQAEVGWEASSSKTRCSSHETVIVLPD